MDVLTDRYFIVTIICALITCLLLGYYIVYIKGFKKCEKIDDMILDEIFKTDGGKRYETNY